MKLPSNIARLALEILLVISLAAGIVWLWRGLQELKFSVWKAQEQLNEIPVEEARTAAVENELAKRALDIERVRAFLVTREQIGDVVGEIESIARQYSVNVVVPEIEEVQKFDESGNPVEPSGPVRDVRLNLVATGHPKQLVQFLHAVEHMSRILYLEAWRLDADLAAAARSSSVIPASAGQAVILTADVILGVTLEESNL